MSHDNNQAKKLDQFLDALAADPDAAPPPGLDEDVAAFARRLMADEKAQPALIPAAQNRIWKQMVAQDHVTANGSTQPHQPTLAYGRETEMLNSKSLPVTSVSQPTETSRWVSSWILAAAVFGIVAMTGMLLYTTNFSGAPVDPTGAGSAGYLQGTDEAQASPTPIASSTPVGMPTLPVTQTPIATPTPVDEIPATMLEDLPPHQDEAEALEIDQPVTNILQADQKRYVYRLTAQRGDLLNVNIQADAHVNFSYSEVSRPTVGNRGVSGGGGGGGGSAASSTPYAETFAIEVMSDSLLHMSINRPAGVEGPIEYTIEVTRREVPQLAYGEVVSDHPWTTPAGSLVRYYEFTGERGDIISVHVDSNLDLEMTLLASDMTPLATDDDGGPGYNPEILDVQLAKSGMYRIRMEPRILTSANLTRSTLEISVERRAPLQLSAEQPLTVSLTSKRTAEVVTFEASAGQTVTLQLESHFLRHVIAAEIVQNGETLEAISLLPQQNPASVPSSERPAPVTASAEIIIPNDGTVTVFINSERMVERFETSITLTLER